MGWVGGFKENKANSAHPAEAGAWASAEQYLEKKFSSVGHWFVFNLETYKIYKFAGLEKDKSTLIEFVPEILFTLRF